MEQFVRKFGQILLAACFFVAPSPVSAGWREDLGTFRIGMLADPGTGRAVAGLPEIERAFSSALKMPVQVFVAKDYAALIDAHATSRIEYAIYSAMAFATARRLCACVDPLVAKRGPGRDIGIRSILLIRNSAMGKDGDLDQIKVAAVQGDSVAGALLPSMALAGPDGPDSIGSGQLVMAASDTEAAMMLVSGKVDGLFGWAPSREEPGVLEKEGTFASLVGQDGIDLSDMRIHWTSGLLRYGPHAVRSDIGEEAKEILLRFLTGLGEKKPDLQEFLTGSVDTDFVEVELDDYQLVYDLVERASQK